MQCGFGETSTYARSAKYLFPQKWGFPSLLRPYAKIEALFNFGRRCRQQPTSDTPCLVLYLYSYRAHTVRKPSKRLCEMKS